MPVDYSHNPGYQKSANGLQTPTVSRCTCGHVLEWHYRIINSGNLVASPAFRHQDADTCPATPFGCPCTVPEWDGQPPAKLPALPTPWSDEYPAWKAARDAEKRPLSA